VNEIQIVKTIGNDIKIKFGLKKCTKIWKVALFIENNIWEIEIKELDLMKA
jgi:hypothetical protein